MTATLAEDLQQQTTRRTRTRKPAGQFVQAVRDMIPLARALDRAKAKLDKVGQAPPELQQEFDAAMIAAADEASPTNLLRLEAATKALRNPRRQKAVIAHEEAAEEFHSALEAVERLLPIA